MLWGPLLPFPDSQAGESDLSLRTLTPVGESLKYNYFAGCGQPTWQMVFPGNFDGNDFACNARDMSPNPGSERSPGGGHGDPLQYFCLEITMGSRAWWDTVHGITKSCILLSD